MNSVKSPIPSQDMGAQQADGLSSPTEPSSTVSALTGFDPSRMTDAELVTAADKLRKRCALQSELAFEDIRVARYEPPSDAVDNRFMRNLEISSRLTRMMKAVRDELDRRAGGAK